MLSEGVFAIQNVDNLQEFNRFEIMDAIFDRRSCQAQYLRKYQNRSWHYLILLLRVLQKVTISYGNDVEKLLQFLEPLASKMQFVGNKVTNMSDEKVQACNNFLNAATKTNEVNCFIF